jgi:DNA-binding MarR family transcriptional regulator
MPRRRDDIEICMEILDLLLENNQVTISEIISYTRIKHSKAKQLLETMEKSQWIELRGSFSDDQRFKNIFFILPEGETVIKYYKDNLKKFFIFLD